MVLMAQTNLLDKITPIIDSTVGDRNTKLKRFRQSLLTGRNPNENTMALTS